MRTLLATCIGDFVKLRLSCLVAFIDEQHALWDWKADSGFLLCCRGQSQNYTSVLSDLNICFVVAYTTEAVLKNTAMGPWKYIRDNW